MYTGSYQLDHIHCYPDFFAPFALANLWDVLRLHGEKFTTAIRQIVKDAPTGDATALQTYLVDQRDNPAQPAEIRSALIMSITSIARHTGIGRPRDCRCVLKQLGRTLKDVVVALSALDTAATAANGTPALFRRTVQVDDRPARPSADIYLHHSLTLSAVIGSAVYIADDGTIPNLDELTFSADSRAGEMDILVRAAGVTNRVHLTAITDRDNYRAALYIQPMLQRFRAAHVVASWPAWLTTTVADISRLRPPGSPFTDSPADWGQAAATLPEPNGATRDVIRRMAPTWTAGLVDLLRAASAIMEPSTATA